MTDKEMGLELKENNVKDNPFDVMLHHSLELTRDLLFACHRLRNPEIPEQFCTNDKRIDIRVNTIKKELSKLLKMSDETVAMCRETSYYYDRNNFELMNETLLKFEHDMQTVWAECVPSRDDRFEKTRLGEDSNEYKHLLDLRKIITESEELSSVDEHYLLGLCDTISNPRECRCYWMTQGEFDEKQRIVEKYNLTIDDIQYMISYRHVINPK